MTVPISYHKIMMLSSDCMKNLNDLHFVNIWGIVEKNAMDWGRALDFLLEIWYDRSVFIKTLQ